MKIKSLIKLREYIAELPGLCGRIYFADETHFKRHDGPCCAVGAAVLLINDDEVTSFTEANQYRAAIQLDGSGMGLIQNKRVEPKFIEFFGKNTKQLYSFFEKLQEVNDDKSDGLSGVGRKNEVLRFIDEYIDSLRRKK